MAASQTVWAEQWSRAQQQNPERNTPEFWDRRAPEFCCRQKAKNEYESDFLQLMRLQPEWSVLDVGCGSGTLAIPLAQRVKTVTALDFSSEMLNLVAQRCGDLGLTNVQPVLGRWEDDWSQLGIATHDVAISSRSLAVSDLRGALIKLDQAARHQVYLSAVVGDGPFDRRIFDVLQRPLLHGPDYLYIYNTLHELGIYANISFIVNQVWKSYDSVAEAIQSTGWMVPDVTTVEEARLQDYFSRELEPWLGKWRLPQPRTIRWAVIHWNKH